MIHQIYLLHVERDVMIHQIYPLLVGKDVMILQIMYAIEKDTMHQHYHLIELLVIQMLVVPQTGKEILESQQSWKKTQS